MFGFGDMDMAMGAGMQMNGMMDMSEGMMLTQMGMPGLGAMEMGIGAMQMGMGQNMMNIGMMQNGMGYGGYGMGMGMGYGMGGMGYGMGYGMGGMGLVAAQTAMVMGCMGMGCTLACCRPGIFRRGCLGIGCNLHCCRPRRGLFGNCRGIGCTGPCCTTTQTIIIRQGNQQQPQYYANNNYQNYQQGYQQGNYVQPQNNYQQQNYRPVQTNGYVNQNYQGNYQNSQNNSQNINNQQYFSQGQQGNNVQQYNQSNQQPQNQQLNQQQNRQNQVYNQKNQQSNDIESNPIKNQNLTANQITPNSGQQNKQSGSLAKYKINESFADDDSSVQQFNFQPNKDQFINPYQDDINQANMQKLNQQSNSNIIYKGIIFKRIGFSWTEYPAATLTTQYFMGDPVAHITKIKVKMDVTHQNTCFLKITMHNNQDHYFGCYKGEQLQWFSSIIWAKMNLVNRSANRFQQFTGYIEGNILRKSQFLGKWEYRYVKIDPNGLRSYRDQNMLPTLNLNHLKQLWCRFQFIEGGTYLVVKCKSNGVKYQYGLPINGFFRWLKAFYSLLI